MCIRDSINIKYTYVGNFDASPENQAKAAAWYSEGTECIFACGGGVGNSVMKAAEGAGKKVIGVDVDQSVESETCLLYTSRTVGTRVESTSREWNPGASEVGVWQANPPGNLKT